MKYISNNLLHFLFSPKYIWKCFQTILYISLWQFSISCSGRQPATCKHSFQFNSRESSRQNVHDKKMLNSSYSHPLAQPIHHTLCLHLQIYCTVDHYYHINDSTRSCLMKEPGLKTSISKYYVENCLPILCATSCSY